MPYRNSDRLRSGRRDRLVTIQQLVESVDPDSGEPIETWTTLVSTMPAARIDLNGWEREKANQLSARYDVEWEINYREDMDPEQLNIPKTRRLVFGGRRQDIVAAVLVGRKAGIRIQTIASAAVEE